MDSNIRHPPPKVGRLPMYVTAPHVCVSTLSWVAYTPSGGSTRPSGGSRFAVGYPNSPPRRLPWITVPRSVYGRPNRVAASAIAPACTRSRILVELTGAMAEAATLLGRSEEHTAEL